VLAASPLRAPMAHRRRPALHHRPLQNRSYQPSHDATTPDPSETVRTAPRHTYDAARSANISIQYRCPKSGCSVALVVFERDLRTVEGDGFDQVTARVVDADGFAAQSPEM